MKHRMIRILTAVVLICALLVSWSPIRARAMAGGGVIGGASAAGLALSPGMVGLLLLAAFGVYYMADNEDAIGRSLEVVLEAEATNTELSLAAQAEYAAALTSWWESAQTGAIDLRTAPGWITDVVKSWASGFISGDSICVPEYVPLTSGTVLHHSLGRNGVFENYSISFSDSTSPVYCYTHCYGRSHYTFLFSLKPFTMSILSSSGLTTKNSELHSFNGYSFYQAYWALSGFNFTYEFGPYCVSATTKLDNSVYKSLFCDVLYNGFNDSVDVFPDVITGGIADQLATGVGMDVIGLPDIVIPGPDVLPVSPSEGQTDAQAVTDYLMAALIAGEITWEQYWQLIGVYNPAIGSSVPTVGTVDPVTGTITNTEISTGTVVTPSAITDYSIDLTSFFPFCLPFDIYAFFELLAAEPETPHLEFDIELPFMQEPWHVVIDLSAWDSTALLARRLELLAFIIGLCVFTREKFLRS